VHLYHVSAVFALITRPSDLMSSYATSSTWGCTPRRFALTQAFSYFLNPFSLHARTRAKDPTPNGHSDSASMRSTPTRCPRPISATTRPLSLLTIHIVRPPAYLSRDHK
jgi:hypothetical protein